MFSKKVLIVNTKNFSYSEWCKKEQAVAEILFKLGHLDYQIFSKEETLEIIRESPILEKSPQKEIESKELNWTIIRILRDTNDFNGEKPNLYYLKDRKLNVQCYEDVESYLNRIIQNNNDYGTYSNQDSDKNLFQIEKLFADMFSFLKREYSHNSKIPKWRMKKH